MKIVLLDQGLEDYLYWQGSDKVTLKKINSLLRKLNEFRSKEAESQSR